MDAVKTYEKMRTGADSNKFFGAPLPKLLSGSLHLEVKEKPAQEMIEAVKAFDAKCGWVQFRDELKLFTATAETIELSRFDLHEAEFFNGNASVHIRYLSAGRYQLVYFQMSGELKGQFTYTEQTYYLRADLAEENSCVLYRHWWLDKNSNGNWLPVTQQFIGFTQASNQQGGD